MADIELVIKIPEKLYNRIKYLEPKADTMLDELMRSVQNGTPQPKIGRWIFDETLYKHYYCSECKSMGFDYWDYCPNCGARMEVSE